MGIAWFMPEVDSWTLCNQPKEWHLGGREDTFGERICCIDGGSFFGFTQKKRERGNPSRISGGVNWVDFGSCIRFYWFLHRIPKFCFQPIFCFQQNFWVECSCNSWWIQQRFWLNGRTFRTECQKECSLERGGHPYFPRENGVCIDLYALAFRGCIETRRKIGKKVLTNCDELPQIGDIFWVTYRV